VTGDSVTSVSLLSAGAAATATVAGSPYSIIPFNAVGTGLANYTISYVPGALTVTPATAVIVVSGYTVPYDGLPHTATGTATGVLGEPLSADLDLTATTHTAVGVSIDGWTFHDPLGNYVDASGTGKPLVETLTGGVWTPTSPALPSDVSVPSGAALVGVSCESAGTCVAIGQYFDTSFTLRPFVETRPG